jgi:G-patch domain
VCVCVCVCVFMCMCVYYWLHVALRQLVQPSRESAGVRLLQSMGWRPGQGVGERVGASADRLAADPHAAEHTFAPTATALYDAGQAKDNLFGLGFDPLRDAPEFRRQRGAGASEVAALNGGQGHTAQRRREAGFGVGVFEEADEISVYDDDDNDDEGKHDRTMRRRLLVDASRTFDSQPSDRHGSKCSSVHSGSTAYDSRHPESAGEYAARTSLRSARDHPALCSDGLPPLDGFVLSGERITAEREWFAPPDVPASFSGRHHFYTSVYATGNDDERTTQLSAHQRGEILGETALPMRHAARQHQHQHQQQHHQHQQRSDRLAAAIPRRPTVALQRSSFQDDPQKQNRFRLYLRGERKQPISMSTAQWTTEQEEFAEAAALQKTLPSALAARFTTAKYVSPMSVAARKPGMSEGGPPPSVAVDAAASAKRSAAEARAHQEEEKEREEAQLADKPPVHTEQLWAPSSLLCKRFNVPMPHDAVVLQQIEADRLKAKTNPLSLFAPPTTTTAASGGGSSHRAQPPAMQTTLEEEYAELERTAEQDEPTPAVAERPPMDLFRSIFAEVDEAQPPPPSSQPPSVTHPHAFAHRQPPPPAHTPDHRPPPPTPMSHRAPPPPPTHTSTRAPSPSPRPTPDLSMSASATFPPPPQVHTAPTSSFSSSRVQQQQQQPPQWPAQPQHQQHQPSPPPPPPQLGHATLAIPPVLPTTAPSAGHSPVASWGTSLWWQRKSKPPARDLLISSAPILPAHDTALAAKRASPHDRHWSSSTAPAPLTTADAPAAQNDASATSSTLGTGVVEVEEESLVWVERDQLEAPTAKQKRRMHHKSTHKHCKHARRRRSHSSSGSGSESDNDARHRRKKSKRAREHSSKYTREQRTHQKKKKKKKKKKKQQKKEHTRPR